MSGDDVLKEFLVKLGWKVDEAGHKKMKEGVQEATKLVNELGIAVDVSLAGMAAFAVKTSEALDKMYYASQRTGSAVQDMKAFDYAMAQTGGSADSAQASLENLAHFMRSYPGSDQFLERLGVAPEHVHDAAKAMEDLGKTFQRMPFWQAQPYANMLGIDEKTLLSLQSGEFNKYLDDYNARLKDIGLNEQDAAKKGHAFQQALRGLLTDADLLGEALVAGPFGVALMWVVDMLDRAARGYAQLLASPQRTADNLTAKTLDDTDWISHYMPGGGSATRFEMQRMRTALASGAPTSAASVQSSAPLGERNNNPGNLRSWGSSATAGGFARFTSPVEGLSAEAGNLQKYGSRGWNTLQSIISHWAPSSENDTAAYIKAMEKSTGYGPDQQLDLNDRGTLEKLMHGINTHEQGRDIYSEGLYGQALDQRLGTTINQQTTINVTGTDPAATATLIGAKQNDVNNQLVRNIGPVVQ